MHWPARILVDPRSLARAVRRLDQAYTTAVDDERPADIAARLSVDVHQLVAANRGRLKGLRKGSSLGLGTVLLVPPAGARESVDDRRVSGCVSSEG